MLEQLVGQTSSSEVVRKFPDIASMVKDSVWRTLSTDEIAFWDDRLWLGTNLQEPVGIALPFINLREKYRDEAWRCGGIYTEAVPKKPTSEAQLRYVHVTHTDPCFDSRIQKMARVSTDCGFDSYLVGTHSGRTEAPAQVARTKRCSSLCDRSIASVSNQVKAFVSGRKAFDTPSRSSGVEQPPVKEGVEGGNKFKRKILRVLNSISVLEVSIRVLFQVARYRPHVVHCHDFYVLPVGLICSWIFKSILIYDAHELESETNLISERKRRLCVFVEKQAWRRIHLLVTVSESIASWYRRQYGSKRTSVIFNSPEFEPELNLYEVGLLPLRQKFGIRDEGLLGLYVGALQRGRGIELVLEAVPDLTNLSVVFLGEGPLSSLVQFHPLYGERVFLHNPVDHRHVVALAATSDFGFCLIENASLSDYYCLPNKFFEYVFAGLPIICSGVPELRAFTEARDLGVVVDIGVDEASKAIAESVEKIVSLSPGLNTLSKVVGLSWEEQAARFGDELQVVKSLKSKWQVTRVTDASLEAGGNSSRKHS